MKKLIFMEMLILMALSMTGAWADQVKDKPKTNLLLEEAHTRDLHSKKVRPGRKVSGKAKKGAPQVSPLVKKNK